MQSCSVAALRRQHVNVDGRDDSYVALLRCAPSAFVFWGRLCGQGLNEVPDFSLLAQINQFNSVVLVPCVEAAARLAQVLLKLNPFDVPFAGYSGRNLPCCLGSS